MAWTQFLNFEKMAMQIIENEIVQMTDNNINHCSFGADVWDEINEEAFLNNLHHGSIAATFIINLYETTLNRIIDRQLQCEEIEFFKLSHEVKLQLICTMCKADLAAIKGEGAYATLKSVIRLRNDITHFKGNVVDSGHAIFGSATIPMGSSKDTLANLFTKKYMQKGFDDVIRLLKIICNNCGFALNTECEVLDSDGRTSLCEFVVNKETYESRKKLD